MYYLYCLQGRGHRGVPFRHASQVFVRFHGDTEASDRIARPAGPQADHQRIGQGGDKTEAYIYDMPKVFHLNHDPVLPRAAVEGEGNGLSPGLVKREAEC